MRFGSVAPFCMMLMTSAVSASVEYPTVKPTPPPSVMKAFTPQTRRVSKSARFLSYRTVASQVDNQVLANLLADAPVHANDIVVSATTGEIGRCESHTCQVPMNVRVDGAQGLVTLTFAVANSKGELSDLQHVECNVGDCVVSLILERGQNTISLGVLDGLAQSTGYTTMRVNATQSVADKGKTEWF